MSGCLWFNKKEKKFQSSTPNLKKTSEFNGFGQGKSLRKEKSCQKDERICSQCWGGGEE
jgi:hypothetical protein